MKEVKINTSTGDIYYKGKWVGEKHPCIIILIASEDGSVGIKGTVLDLISGKWDND